MGESREFWFDYHDGEVSLPQERLLASMQELGMRLFSREDGNPRRAGIFLFESEGNDMEADLRRCCREAPDRVIAVSIGTRRLTSRMVKRLKELGAGYVLGWGNHRDPAVCLASRFLRWEKVDAALEAALLQVPMAGCSPAWLGAMRQLAENVLTSNAPILVNGETGTGKELMSRLAHALEPKPGKGCLTVLDCASVVPGLSGSEFFGHERGAFTNAISSREGAFAMAAGGTLFLDEIGELPASIQPELLRVLQEGKVKRVGSQDWKSVDFRLVSATNRDLKKEVAEGRFRQDLYYRLAGWIITLPPLRDRLEDLEPLARSFAEEVLGPGTPVEIEPDLLEYLLTRDYPGNVRELRNLVRQIAAFSAGGRSIGLGDLPSHAMAGDGAPDTLEDPPDIFDKAVRLALLRRMTLKEITREAASAALEQALKFEGTLQAAAVRLGVCKRTLELQRMERRKEEKHGKRAHSVQTG